MEYEIHITLSEMNDASADGLTNFLPIQGILLSTELALQNHRE